MIGSEAMAGLMGEEQSPEDELAGLQQLVDSGAAWTLEGHVGRTCMRAIEDGAIVLGPTGHRDYWGNYVPSRFEVQEGTKGSITFAHATGERMRENIGGGLHDATTSARCGYCKRLRAERPLAETEKRALDGDR